MKQLKDRISNLADWQQLMLLLLALFMVRIGFLLVSPLDLISDEAYYWDWSRRLDWCYYSKPPMIAWLNWLSSSLVGSTTFTVRLTAAVMGTAGLVFVYLLGRDMFSPQAGLFAVLLTAATPGNALQSALMTIDVPFLFFWCGSLWLFWRWANSENHRTVWAIATGVMIAFGVLSKQTMLGFLPLSVMFLFIAKEDRIKLVSPNYFLLVGVALSSLVPILLWNAQHDWITFQHTASHFDGETVGIGNRISRSAEFIGSQIGALTPIVGLLLMTVFVSAIRYRNSLTRKELYLLCFSAVPLLGVIGLSLKQRLEPNWPAAFYPAGIILLASCLVRTSEFANQISFSNRYKFISVTMAACCSLLFYLAVIAVPHSPIAGSSLDFTARLRGWSELAGKVQSQLPGDYAEKNVPIISTTGRSYISELAFYLPSQSRISRWTNSSEIHSQYDLWSRYSKTAAVTNRETIILTEVDKPLNERFANSFESIEPLGEATVALGPNRNRSVRIWLARTTQSKREKSSSTIADSSNQGASRR